MRCIYCNSTESKVVDSRPTEDGMAIRRRRECIGCGRRFTTYETIENPMIMVVKKDGTREAYSREKVRNGVMRACEKRPVSMADIDGLVADVERAMFNSLDQEITSASLGELVMERLQQLDQVAYVRFASVYREFRDLNTFLDELNRLLRKEKE